MTTLCFCYVPGIPHAQGRPRGSYAGTRLVVGKGGGLKHVHSVKMHDDPDSRAWKATVTKATFTNSLGYRAARDLWRAPVVAVMHHYVVDGRGMRQDQDNLDKSVLDGMKKAVYGDDCWVQCKASGKSVAVEGYAPGVAIWVAGLEKGEDAWITLGKMVADWVYVSGCQPSPWPLSRSPLLEAALRVRKAALEHAQAERRATRPSPRHPWRTAGGPGGTTGSSGRGTKRI